MDRNFLSTVFEKRGRFGLRPVREEAEKFDIEDRWPELFTRLDDVQRNAVRQSLAAAWHEGWVPSREEVENLTDEARGAIDEAEYLQRVREAGRRGDATIANPR